MNKLRIAFNDIASRITGISLPIFGISWNPPESDRQIVRETFIFLEDRRALYNPCAHEIDHQVTDSVLAIRGELTSALKRLSENSEVISHFKEMRYACREYLDSTNNNNRYSGGPFSFMTELGKLRAMIGIQVAHLSVKYGIDVDGDLVRIIPAYLRDAKYLEE